VTPLDVSRLSGSTSTRNASRVPAGGRCLLPKVYDEQVGIANGRLDEHVQPRSGVLSMLRRHVDAPSRLGATSGGGFVRAVGTAAASRNGL